MDGFYIRRTQNIKDTVAYLHSMTRCLQKHYSVSFTNIMVSQKCFLVYCTVHGKILVGEKLTNLGNREPFAKIFLTNIHRYAENVYGICTDCRLFAKFFLTNSFYLYGSPKFSPAKYFPCTVLPRIQYIAEP